MGPPKCWAPGNCQVCPPLEPALHITIVITSDVNDAELRLLGIDAEPKFSI